MGRPSKGERVTVTLRLPVAVVERVDAARGVQSRSDFAAQAIDGLLLALGGSGRAQGAGPKGRSPRTAPLTGVSSPALPPQAPAGPDPAPSWADGGSLTAVGGWCAPTDELWELAELAQVPDEPPDHVQVPRGGTQFVLHHVAGERPSLRALSEGLPITDEARESATSMMAMAVSRSEESIRGWLRERGIDPDDLEAAKEAFAALAEEDPDNPGRLAGEPLTPWEVALGAGQGWPAGEPLNGLAVGPGGETVAARIPETGEDWSRVGIATLTPEMLEAAEFPQPPPARQSGKTAAVERLIAQLPEGSVVIASQHVHSAGDTVSRRIASGRVFRRVRCASCDHEWETA